MADVVTIPADRYDAAVFDMDGVITDTASVHAAAWRRTFDDYLLERSRRTGEVYEPFSASDYLRYVDGKPRDDGVASFLASRGVDLPRGSPDDRGDVETVWGVANRKNKDFMRVLAEDGARAFPSSVALVRDLQHLGVKTAIISASRNLRPVLEAAGIADLFPVIVDGVEMERLGLPGKPSPAVFLEAASRLGARPERSIVVEDAIAGVQAGRAGGFGLVIGVDRGGNAVGLREGGADVVVSDLAQVRVVPHAPAQEGTPR